jgi:hypothetical protein
MLFIESKKAYGLGHMTGLPKKDNLVLFLHPKTGYVQKFVLTIN